WCSTTARSASAAPPSNAATRPSVAGTTSACRTSPMREARVIALAGVIQASRLVHEIATRGRSDSASVESSLASVFRIDSDSAADVFGGLSGIRLGLETLIAQFDGSERSLPLTQLALGTLRLRRRLSRNPRMMAALRTGIEEIQRQVDHL